MKSKTKNTLVSIVFFVICIGLGGLLGLSMTHEFGDTLSWWLAALRITEGVFLFFAAFFLQIILHEAGHMVAALLRGWSFVYFMVLGFVLSRKNGKFHLSRFAIPGVGGQCMMMPPEKRDTDFGIAFYNAGGVLMNIIVALLAIVLLGCFYEFMVWDVTVFLASLSFSGLLFALVNGVPSVSGGVPNDGMNIRKLRKDAYSTYVFLTVMRVMGQLQQGLSVDEAVQGYLTDGVKVDYANPIHEVAVNFDFSLAVARLDFEKAHKILDKIEAAFDQFVPIYQKEITYERVFLYLVSPREGVDVSRLIDWDTLKYFEMQANFRPTSLRVKYAYARLYEKDEAKAEAIYERFQEVCKSFHIPGEVITEKKLVEYVRALSPSERC